MTRPAPLGHAGTGVEEVDVRIALFQGPERSGGPADNIVAIDEAAAEAAAAGAVLLVCPEMSATGYNIGPDAVRERSEPADGELARRLARTAREHTITLVYGYPERAGDVVHNAVAVVGPEGELLAHYRKGHLFGELDRAMFAPGDDGVVQFSVGGLTAGLLVCYDVEFPEAVRAHALAGTELLVVPTGLMSPYETISETVVPVRALESQVFVAYANRTGAEGDLRYCGLSCVAGPDGRVLARAGRGQELLVVDLDPALLLRARRETTYLQDLRPELYSGRPTPPRGTR